MSLKRNEPESRRLGPAALWHFFTEPAVQIEDKVVRQRQKSITTALVVLCVIFLVGIIASYFSPYRVIEIASDIGFIASMSALLWQVARRYFKHIAYIEQQNKALAESETRLKTTLSQRRQIEEQMRQSQQFLQSALDALTNHIAILDDRGTIIAVNRAWHRYAEAQISKGLNYEIGANYLEVCDRAAKIGVEFSREAANGIRQVLNDQQDSFYQAYSTDSGSERQWFIMRVNRFQDEGGRVRLAVSHQNVTELKQVEEALRVSEVNYRMLMEQAAEAIWVTDTRGMIMIANRKAERTLRYEPGELVGKNVLEVMSFRPAHVEGGGDDTPSSQTLVREWRFKRKDGSEIAAEGSTKRLDNGFYQTIFRDITERKQSEVQRINLAIEKEKIEVLRRFLRDMSHDLRTPLTTVKTSIYMLRRTLDNPDRRERYLDTLESQSEHLERVIEDLLLLSRLDTAETGVFVFKPIDLNVIIHPMLNDKQLMAEHKHLSLRFVPDPVLPMVMLDEMEFKRAFNHLLLNAVNYTPERGLITVKTCTEEKFAVVEVTDTGVGINADDLPHIFDTFYRSDPARNTDTGGTGLGLTIVKKIIEAHGGSIEVESEPGKGSTFRLRLPAGVYS